MRYVDLRKNWKCNVSMWWLNSGVKDADTKDERCM